MASILIVEDEPDISELIRRTLHMVGYKSFQAFRGREALDMLGREKIDLILLDINLPDCSGFELMKEITDVPVIYVTARDEVGDKVKGLYSGAQDYIVKPFDIEELLARVHLVLKRCRKESTIYSFQDIEIHTDSYKVYKAHAEVELTNREYELLLALVQNKNMALKRSRLLDIAWGMDYEGEERTVDVHVQRIRRKLGLEQEIKTVFKYGYRLEI